MARIHSIQTSFNLGEITPRLLGRVDLAKYGSSLKTMTNMLPSPYGGAFRRPGTKYIAELENNATTAELIPFEFSDSESYIIELNAGSFRFYRNQGLILQSRDFLNGDFTSDISNWTDLSAGTGAISYSSGTMQLVGAGSGNEAATEQAISNLGISQYTVSLDITTNSIDYKVGSSSGASDIASGTLSTGSQSFNFTATDNYDNIYIGFEIETGTATIDNVALNSPVYKIKNPFAQADLATVRFTQSSDVLYLVHEDYMPRKLIRYDNDEWALEQITFIDGPYLDTGFTTVNGVLSDSSTTTLTPDGTTGSITFTASSGIFNSTDVGRYIRYKAGPDLSDETTYTGNGTQTYFDIPFFPRGQNDVEVYLAGSTGQRVLKTYTTHYTISDGQVIFGTAPASTDVVIIRPVNAGSGEWGYATITSYTSATEVDATVIIDLAGTNASTEWRLGSWSSTTGYPSVVTFHEQRLVFGASIAEPQTFWGSQSYNFENFSPDNVLNKGDTDADSSYTYTVASLKSDKILWMSSKGKLLLGTASSIYSVAGNNTGITASSINIRKESSTGSESHVIAETDTQALFIKKLGREINSVGFRFEKDGYVNQNLSLFSEHLGTESGFNKIAFQDIPNKILWILREDNSLVSLTYMEEQDVIGWAKHIIGGTGVSIEAIATIPSTTENELYLLVSRTIDGGTVRYVEVLTPEFNQGNKEDAKFMDSLATYSGSAATTISGLNHLEGESVTILADGAVHPNKTVASGQITLDYSAEKVQIGLGYDSEIETNFIEAGTPFGTTQATIQRVLEAGVRFLDSLNTVYGYSSSSTDRLVFRASDDLMDSSPPLFTGIKTFKFPHGHETGSKIYIKQDQPYPLHILSIVLKLEVTER